MKFATSLPLLVYVLAGSVTSAWTETFGACNYTSFVAQAVGICEKRFYTDLANDLQADCRTCYDRMLTCYLKMTRQCLDGHYSEAQIQWLAKITLLIQKFLGASQWYCSNKPMNISSLDPAVRALIPCTDKLFTEGHKCTREFREIFNANRNDPSLCKAFSRSRSCTQSVFDLYCNGTIPVPTENRFNPFCTNTGNETIVASQASTKPRSDTNIWSKSRHPTASGARRNIRVLSRMLSMAVGVVNLTNVVRGLVMN